MQTAFVHAEPVRNRRDDEWLAELRAGEPDAVEAWLRSRVGALVNLAHRYLRAEVVSEKVVRDVLLRALQAIANGEDDAASPKWLRARTLDAVMTTLRHRSSRPECIEALLPRFRLDGTHEAQPKPWDDDRLRGDVGAFSQVVQRCIDRLPEPHRAVLMLSDGERLEASSIARGLAMSEGAVRSTLHDARLALRALLDPILRAGMSTPHRDADP